MNSYKLLRVVLSKSIIGNSKSLWKLNNKSKIMFKYVSFLVIFLVRPLKLIYATHTYASAVEKRFHVLWIIMFKKINFLNALDTIMIFSWNFWNYLCCWDSVTSFNVVISSTMNRNQMIIYSVTKASWQIRQHN